MRKTDKTQRNGCELPAKLSLTRYLPRYGILHTGFIDEMNLVDTQIQYRIYVQSGPWSGKSAADCAKAYARRNIAGELGDTPHVPEFIMVSGGTYKPNPEYGKMRFPEPKLSSAGVWRAIADWWLENKASPDQKALVEQDQTLMTRLMNNVPHGTFRGLGNDKELRRD